MVFACVIVFALFVKIVDGGTYRRAAPANAVASSVPVESSSGAGWSSNTDEANTQANGSGATSEAGIGTLSSESTGSSGLGLGVTRAQVSRFYRKNGFTVTRGTDIAATGQPRYMATKGNVYVEYIGDEDDIVQASVMISVPDGSSGEEHVQTVRRFLRSIEADNVEDEVLTWLAESVATGGEIVLDDRHFSVISTRLTDGAMVILTVKSV